MTESYIVRTNPPIDGRELHEIVVAWADADDLKRLASWKCEEDDPDSNDAAEFAQSAISKWTLADAHRRTAPSLSEMQRRIAAKPDVEVSGLLVAKGTWWTPQILAFALFHRTWEGNVYLDFVAAHPGGRGLPTVFGVGPMVLNSLCQIAEKLDAEFVWGETTDISADKYRQFFHCPKRDLLRLTKLSRSRFMERSRELLETRRKQLAAKS